MSLYYSDDYVTLYHGDCLDEHREWLAADVLVTDPPYGRAWKQGELRGHARNQQSSGIANDNTTGVRDAALELWGLTKPTIAFGDLMLAPPDGTKLACVYHKADGTTGLRGAIGGVRRDAEAIYLIGKWIQSLAASWRHYSASAHQEPSRTHLRAAAQLWLRRNQWDVR